MANAFVLIVGPTASGKSALAAQLAETFQASILNCDSLQAYQRLDIGSAKPSVSERSRCPHFLFDFVPPGQELTAGDFRRSALEILKTEILQRSVFGVGGSGFYIQALEKGMFKTTKPSPALEQTVREELKIHGLPWMHARLRQVDPESAERINPNDEYRILRALIVNLASGRKLSDLRAEFRGEPFPYPLLKIGLALTPAQLQPRVKERTWAMLENGLMDEVSALVREGFANWPPLQSVGYKECLQVLNGELAPEKLEEQILLKTMQLAKKQKTWFKRDPQIQWLEYDQAALQAPQIVARFLDSLS